MFVTGRGAKRRRSKAFLTITAGVALALGAGPALAQNGAPQSLLPPTPVPGNAAQAPTAATATPATPQVAVPAPVVAAPTPPAVPLPTLSPAQATQLAALLKSGRIAHGLRSDAVGAADVPSDNDALVCAALDYAHAVHAGRLDKSDFSADWGLRPAPYDPLPGFAAAVARDRIPAWAAALAPPYAGYDGLAKGLATYRAIAVKSGWKPVPAGPDLSVGASGARVAALRRRLAVEDDTIAATGDKFDAALKDAVLRAQRRYGLNPTGTVSTGTLAALNVPAEARVRQIMANMERWRWLPQELPKDRVQVNIAAAVLTVFDGDVPVMSMKGVTGRPGDGETPMLSSAIHSIVLNPPWNVPDGIAKRELFPKGAGYLKANGFRVIETPDGGKRLQQASERSALGKYKFDFDNPYAVYLHDTPTQATFNSFSRLASHGCIRLEKPGALAELLLRSDPAWSPEAIQAAVAKGKTLRVRLTNQAQVYLLYWTAFASGSGAMNFRADPYEWDGELADKIQKRSLAQATIAR